jgi:hypothetical protein
MNVAQMITAWSGPQAYVVCSSGGALLGTPQRVGQPGNVRSVVDELRRSIGMMAPPVCLTSLTPDREPMGWEASVHPTMWLNFAQPECEAMGLTDFVMGKAVEWLRPLGGYYLYVGVQRVVWVLDGVLVGSGRTVDPGEWHRGDVDEIVEISAVHLKARSAARLPDRPIDGLLVSREVGAALTSANLAEIASTVAECSDGAMLPTAVVLPVPLTVTMVGALRRGESHLPVDLLYATISG